MDVKFEEFGIYNIDVGYLRYLHDNIDTEVYYASQKYESKPFLGIVVGIGAHKYFIPFTSCKPKHLKWRNVSPDHYLVYETVAKDRLPSNAFYKPMSDGMVKHILAVLDLKKMIPVPVGVYAKVDFSAVADSKYKDLLEKEYRFCQGIQDGILERVHKIYDEQMSTKTVHRFYCNFAALEKGCDEYKTE